MPLQEGEISIHITDDTDQWNRVALALSGDGRRPIPEFTKILGAMSALLIAYEDETKVLIEQDKLYLQEP